MRRRIRPVFAAMALLAVFAGAGCGEKLPAPPSADPSSPFGRTEAERGAGPFTATHILVASRNKKMPEIERSKTQALAAALAVIEKLSSGSKLDAMVALYTDDKSSVGRPGEKDGQYTFGPAAMVPSFEKAVRETPVGKIFPDPVESEYGYHILRRDK